MKWLGLVGWIACLAGVVAPVYSASADEGSPPVVEEGDPPVIGEEPAVKRQANVSSI